MLKNLWNWVTKESWSHLLAFLGVLSILAALLYGPLNRAFPDRMTAVLGFFGLNQSDDDASSHAALTSVENKSQHRRIANRCRTQLLEASVSEDKTAASRAAECAEQSYLAAVEEGDTVGYFGLTLIYTDARFANATPAPRSPEEFELLAQESWCQFVANGRSEELKLQNAFSDIVCD